MTDFDDTIRNPWDANMGNQESEEADVGMDAFLPHEDENVLAGADEGQVITIRTSSGASHYVASTTPLSLAEVKVKSGLTFMSGTQVFLNNAMIEDSTIVPLGATVVAVGSVKGG